MQETDDFRVTVSFLEIYNEQLQDSAADVSFDPGNVSVSGSKAGGNQSFHVDKAFDGGSISAETIATSGVTLTVVEGHILHQMGLDSCGDFGLENEHLLAKRDLLKVLVRRLSAKGQSWMWLL